MLSAADETAINRALASTLRDEGAKRPSFLVVSRPDVNDTFTYGGV
jgi:hypothetical protein